MNETFKGVIKFLEAHNMHAAVRSLKEEMSIELHDKL